VYSSKAGLRLGRQRFSVLVGMYMWNLFGLDIVSLHSGAYKNISFCMEVDLRAWNMSKQKHSFAFTIPMLDWDDNNTIWSSVKSLKIQIVKEWHNYSWTRCLAKYKATIIHSEESWWQITEGLWRLYLHDFKQLLQSFVAARIR
jgi:hypothetical protein